MDTNCSGVAGCAASSDCVALCNCVIICCAWAGLYPNATRASWASRPIDCKVPLLKPLITGCALAGSRPCTFDFSSTIRRSAVFLPTPGTLVSTPTSLFCTASDSVDGSSEEMIANASFGPTPLILTKVRNNSRSAVSQKPNNSCASSRTTK